MIINTVNDNNYEEETPDLLSDSIIQMHNDLKNSPLYPEPKPKNPKSAPTTSVNDNNSLNNNSSFIVDASPGNLIPYGEDIKNELNDISSSSSLSSNHLNNEISLDPDFNILNDYSNNEVQTLQDEMEAVVYGEEPIDSVPEKNELVQSLPEKPSEVLFPENDGSLESLLLMLKVPPTQDVFQLIVQNAMGNDLPVSQKVFLSMENNDYVSKVNFPSTAYNHLNNKNIENQYIANTSASPSCSRGVLTSESSNKVIIRNVTSNEPNNNNKYSSMDPFQYENNANLYFPQMRTKDERQRLQQYQKQKRRASTDFMDLVSQVPYWVDWEKISKGQDVFWKYGLPLWISTTLYAMTKGAILPLMDPLNSSGHSKEEKSGSNGKKKNKNQLLPSYLETSQIIIESMMSDSLRPGGVAWKSLIQIRCRHAQFRVDYVDNSFDLQELHDYLSEGIKYYEKQNKKQKAKEKENWEMDEEGNLRLISKSKPEAKRDMKIIEFTYPSTKSKNNQYLISDSNSQNEVDEDEEDINLLKGKTSSTLNGSKTNKLKSKSDSKSNSNKITNYYPTPSSSPTPNHRKNKKNGLSNRSSTKNNQEQELPPIQKEVMSLPTELLDSLFPINQISLAKTILYLSIGSIKAMERIFGIELSKEEEENYLLVWRYISWVCGLEDKRGTNYGNKIITPKYAEIAINYFFEKDPLVSWDDELVYHAQGIINSLSLTIPIIGATSFMKSIVNEVSRKFTYFTSMPIPKEMTYSLTITLPNNITKVFSLSFLTYLIHWIVNPIKRIENNYDRDSSSTSSFNQYKRQYYNNNENFDARRSKTNAKGKYKYGEESSSTSITSASQKYNRYKKKVDYNVQLIHGKKSYISSGIASLFIILIKYINNILGLTDIGLYFMNRINQSLIPKLIWIANNYQWVDFSRIKIK